MQHTWRNTAYDILVCYLSSLCCNFRSHTSGSLSNFHSTDLYLRDGEKEILKGGKWSKQVPIL